MVQACLGDCVKVIKRLVMVVVAVMAVGDLKLKGLVEAHGHLLVVDKEVGLVLLLLLLLDPLLLHLVAGHEVCIEQVLRVGDHDHKPKRVDKTH